MTDHTDPVVSSGGFCSPSDEFFKPREIPGTTDELTLSWDGNVTAARERAELYRTNGRRLRGHRADLEADAWHNVATIVRSVSWPDLLPDLLERFAQTQDNLIPTLPRKTVERRRARANAYVYHLAALELRICLGGGGPMPVVRLPLPVVQAPRGGIRYLVPPPAAAVRPCDCGSTDVHELGTGPYCSALAEYGAAEANQAPGPDWKAKLRGEVEEHRDNWTNSWMISAIDGVLALIDALPDPPTCCERCKQEQSDSGWPDALCFDHRESFTPTPDPDADEAPDDLLYRAWGLIANACGGDWDEADRFSPGWKPAAIGWREAWHATLPGSADPVPTAPTPDPDAPPVYVPPEGHYIVRGEDVRTGWEGRRSPDDAVWLSARMCNEYPSLLFEARRVPAPEPATGQP